MPRVVLQMADEGKETLQTLAEKEGRNEAEILRRALGVYSWISEQIEDPTEEVIAVANKGTGKVKSMMKFF
jgi:predicted DNA-binding protein